MAHYHHPLANHPLRGASVGRAGTRPIGDDHADLEEGRLLIGPAFWIGGALSLAAWVALAVALGLI
jgi:hypothetical protein